MRNFKNIMEERDRKIKEYEDSVRLNEKIKKQWNDIELNIDNHEINKDTKRLFICHGDIYEENKYKLVKDYGFHLDSFNKEIFSYTHNIIKDTEYCTCYYLDGIDNNTTVTEELNKNCLGNKKEDKIYKNRTNNIKTIINYLNDESDDKYNLNDGQHNNRKDVFGKRINKENKINIDNADKSSEKSDETTIQMYK